MQDSLAIFGQISDPWRLTQAQALLAAIRQAQGDITRSEELFEQAFDMGVVARATPYALNALVGLAELYAQTGREAAAHALARYVTNHPAGSDQAGARAREVAAHVRQRGATAAPALLLPACWLALVSPFIDLEQQ